MLANLALTASKHELDLSEKSFGELRNSADFINETTTLRERLAEDGYLYLRGFFDRAKILTVRKECLRRLALKGALNPGYPVEEAIASETAVPLSRQEIFRDNPLIAQLTFSPQLLAFYQRLLGGPVRHYDHIWIRLIRPGCGTHPHCDLPYMGRGTKKVMTAWIPYGDVSLQLGGLMILEKSHLQADRIRPYLESDADTYCTNRNAYKNSGSYLSTNPVSLREKLGGRWLTTEFQAGDLLTFGMTTIHASLDNQSNSYRISTDTRYQLASEPIDERWIGSNTEEYAERNRVGQIC